MLQLILQDHYRIEMVMITYWSVKGRTEVKRSKHYGYYIYGMALLSSKDRKPLITSHFFYEIEDYITWYIAYEAIISWYPMKLGRVTEIYHYLMAWLEQHMPNNFWYTAFEVSRYHVTRFLPPNSLLIKHPWNVCKLKLLFFSCEAWPLYNYFS